jgi:hypothetical protein
MNIEDLDNRMLQLYHELKSRGILKYKRAFCAACDIPEQNMYNVEKKRNHFTLIHVANICRYYSLNANWIIDLNETELFRKPITNRKQIKPKTVENEVISNT